MKDIFLVVMSGGEYEDKWEKTLLATFDEQEARNLIAERQKQDATFAENYRKLSEAECEFDGMYPYPRMEGEYALEPIPKWRAGLGRDEITQEMFDERQTVRERNDTKIKLYKEVVDQRQKKRHEYLVNFLNSIGIEGVAQDQYFDALSLADDHSERSYSIEKVPFV